MFDPFTAMLIGAGVGGTYNLLSGKDPLKGAAIGAGVGGLGAGGANLAGGGTFMGATGTGGVGSTLAAGAVPTSSVVPGSIGSSGMVFNPSTGSYLNPEYFVGSSTPFATYTGGQGLLSNAMGNISSTLPDYVTPQNVMGAANILAMSQPRQQQLPTAPGGMKQGNTQGLTVNYGMAQPMPRKRGLV